MAAAASLISQVLHSTFSLLLAAFCIRYFLCCLAAFFTLQSLILQLVFQNLTLYAIIAGDARMMSALYTMAVYVGSQGIGLSLLFYKVCVRTP